MLGYPFLIIQICNKWSSHYLNQWWPSLLMHIYVTRPQYIKNELSSNPTWNRTYFAIVHKLHFFSQIPCCQINNHLILIDPFRVGVEQIRQWTRTLGNYRQVSNIRRTKSQHSQDSRTVLRLSLPNPLKPDLKSRMKMYLEQRRSEWSTILLPTEVRLILEILRYLIFIYAYSSGSFHWLWGNIHDLLVTNEVNLKVSDRDNTQQNVNSEQNTGIWFIFRWNADAKERGFQIMNSWICVWAYHSYI